MGLELAPDMWLRPPAPPHGQLPRWRGASRVEWALGVAGILSMVGWRQIAVSLTNWVSLGGGGTGPHSGKAQPRPQPSLPDGATLRGQEPLIVPLWDKGLRVYGGLLTHVGDQALGSGVRSCRVTTITGQVLEPLLIPTWATGSGSTEGRRILLLCPQQGHFQGLSKVWEGQRPILSQQCC